MDALVWLHGMVDWLIAKCIAWRFIPRTGLDF